MRDKDQFDFYSLSTIDAVVVTFEDRFALARLVRVRLNVSAGLFTVQAHSQRALLLLSPFSYPQLC